MEKINVIDEFRIEKPENVILKIYANGKYFTTTLGLFWDRNHTFFCGEINHEYDKYQKLVFRYGSRMKENKNEWQFDLRVDKKDQHLNFDEKINEHCINNIVSINQEKKRLKNFFLHEIEGIPKNLIIEIYNLNIGNKMKENKPLKKYQIRIN
ncbi:MAG: hypothetical protein ACOCUU_03035 [Nanoarchaeota archaeon]